MFRRKTTKDLVKEASRGLAVDMRELDKDLQGLKREEVKVIADIKSSANAGNVASTKVLAQQLVRLRAHMQRLQAAKAGLQGVAGNLSAAATNSTIAASLKNASRAMAAVGSKANPAQTQQQLQQFSRAAAKQQAAQEMLGESLDLAFDLEEDEERQTQELVRKLMDEVGLEVAAELRTAPQRAAQAPAVPLRPPAVAVAAPEEEDELMLRLAALRS